jgi:fucose permease
LVWRRQVASVLGFGTERYGERSSVTAYLAITFALQIVFRIVNSVATSVVAVTFLGLFLGPLFPSGVVMVTRLLPKYLHVSALAIAAAIGQTGGAFSSFAVGALTQRWGVQIFQAVIVGHLLLVLSSWLSFLRLKTEEVPACVDTEMPT